MVEEEKVVLPPVVVEVTDYLCTRRVEHIGNELIRGESTYELVLKFPNGDKFLVTVPEEAFESYLEAAGVPHDGGTDIPDLGSPS